MKAVQFKEFGDPSVLKLEELPNQPLNAGQVRIKIAAAGVNFADTLQRRNKYPAPPQLPSIPGFEVAGTIDEIAPDVKDLKVGDRVVAMLESGGGYSDSVVCSARGAFEIADGVSFEQAAALPGQALTAYFMFKDAPLLKGQSVMFHAAAGGVGSVAAQIAKLLGAGKVIGTTSTKLKMEKLAAYGYDYAVNISDADWPKQVLSLTDGKGVDLIFDSVSGPVFEQSLTCLAPGGGLTVFGRASGQDCSLNPVMLMGTNQRVSGFSLWKYMGQKAALVEAMSFLYKGLLDGKLKVDFEVYPLSKAADVHKMLEGRSSTGKLLLKP